MSRALAIALMLLLLGGCRAPSPEAPVEDPGKAWETLGLKGSLEEFERAVSGLRGVTLDPPPVWGRDYHPSFPPDRPFRPEEWETNRPSPSVAEPEARRGGTLRLAMASYPPTLRTEGPNSRLAVLSDIHSLIYEPMLDYDMVVGGFVPNLATHWQVSEDRLTYRFRLNPAARWADGRPVTADDVLATFEHLMNPDRRDPAVTQHWRERIAEIRVLDRYTVEFRVKEPLWRAMIEIAGQPIYPAAYIRMDGETYLTDWNWKLPPGSGPYELRSDDVVKGRSLTLRRRDDWWAEGLPRTRGMYNFDAIRWEVITDEELAYQKFLAGELDVLRILRAQRWVDEVDREPAVRHGWVQKRKIYNREPQGYGGYCFNMRVPPFDSREVREAFAHLFNREKLFEKFFFYQYEYIDSYFPGQIWARPDARPVRYDPRRARELLRQAGWVKRDAEGYLVNARGERFPTLTLMYAQQGFDRIHQVVADDLWQQAGIKMELKFLDYPSLLKQVWEYRYRLVYWGWTASLFPDPEFQFHSKYAGQPQTNNLNGYANPEADRLMEEYRYEFDFERRKRLLQRLDAILFEDHPYALGWYAPYFRILYWDRFGHPPEYCDPFTSDLRNIMVYWWYDEERARRTEENKARGVPNYPDRPLNQYDDPEQTWWLSHRLPMGEEGGS